MYIYVCFYCFKYFFFKEIVNGYWNVEYYIVYFLCEKILFFVFVLGVGDVVVVDDKGVYFED